MTRQVHTQNFGTINFEVYLARSTLKFILPSSFRLKFGRQRHLYSPMTAIVVSLCISIHRSSSAPDLSLIFLESLEYFIELYLVNCILELLLSILSKRFRCSNESNQKAIRDRSSKVEMILFWKIILFGFQNQITFYFYKRICLK